MKEMRFILLLTIMALSGSISMQAQTLSNNEVLQRKGSAFFLTEQAHRVGDLLLLYQRDTGGWPKNVNMVMPLTAEQQDSVRQQKVRLDDSTIDNKATTMQMTFLARLYQQTRDERYAWAFRRAMEFLLNGQYDNGGWPQFWPKNRDYQVHITYFCDRDGQPKRSLQEIGYERRNGYGWYNDQPQELYARYETWVKKNKIANRVSFK